MLSLRSKARAGPVVFGPATIMCNLCPTEMGAVWVFKMGSPMREYTFAVNGDPVGRMDKNECRRYIAKNWYACAHFFEVYFQAFNKVLMGWPNDEPVQLDENCLFGKILSRIWHKEESGRKGAHTHGIHTQPFWHAQNLRKLFSEGTSAQESILAFGEALMRAYMPRAQDYKPLERKMEVRGIRGNKIITQSFYYTTYVLYFPPL